MLRQIGLITYLQAYNLKPGTLRAPSADNQFTLKEKPQIGVYRWTRGGGDVGPDEMLNCGNERCGYVGGRPEKQQRLVQFARLYVKVEFVSLRCYPVAAGPTTHHPPHYT